MKLKVLALACLFLFLSSGFGYALTFSDDFSDESYTSKNWVPFIGSWTVDGDRYVSNDDNNQDASIASNGQEFYNDGLSIETVFSPLGNHAQAFFSVYYDSQISSFDGYAVGISNYVNNEFSFNIVTLADRGAGHEIAIQGLSEFDPTLDYRMKVSVDDTLINAYLYLDNSLIASLNNVEQVISGKSGIVGLSTDTCASYEYYTVSGNAVAPVPEPSSVLLLGTGILCLAGSKRRYFIK